MPQKYKSCLRKVRVSTKKRYGYRKYNEYAICSKLRGKHPYHIKNFRTKTVARKFQRSMKRNYGYTPKLFIHTDGRKNKYTIIKPKKIHKIKKK